jgi:hypothetical protein
MIKLIAITLLLASSAACAVSPIEWVLPSTVRSQEATAACYRSGSNNCVPVVVQPAAPRDNNSTRIVNVLTSDGKLITCYVRGNNVTCMP